MYREFKVIYEEFKLKKKLTSSTKKRLQELCVKGFEEKVLLC